MLKFEKSGKTSGVEIFATREDAVKKLNDYIYSLYNLIAEKEKITNNRYMICMANGDIFRITLTDLKDVKTSAKKYDNLELYIKNYKKDNQKYITRRILTSPWSMIIIGIIEIILGAGLTLISYNNSMNEAYKNAVPGLPVQFRYTFYYGLIVVGIITIYRNSKKIS